MNKLATLAAAAAIAIAAVPAVVIAQGTTQTIAAVDVKMLATGLRSSKIVGSEVVNENKDIIGKIDDLRRELFGDKTQPGGEVAALGERIPGPD
jgi:1-aminocyclopropane-1-carboxylate deaminase/D-cysteine desulfhydrase-like pyridoxal-dependent ACC family enzyme